MSDGMGREFTYLSSHATNRYFIPNWGIIYKGKNMKTVMHEDEKIPKRCTWGFRCKSNVCRCG